MSQHKVTFLPHNRKINVNTGESLIRAAMEAGVHVNASCGGEGVCGKCRVIVEAGTVDGGESERLSAQDLAAGYRLACQAAVKSDLTVRIPVESSVDTSALGTRVTPRQTAR
ncbi:MAG: 2Fe-2S iron-sulfur cluster binding domain-containing protein, partial [Desulfobacterales bacterium]|nr:2Fe-2S iron-sulfur cluster binding domain-containing protein [Desulfobacterales bacterium]